MFNQWMAARGVLVVCDLTRENTFEAVAKWKAEIDEWASIERNLNIPVVLIANKVRSLPSHHESKRISFLWDTGTASFLGAGSSCSFFPESLPQASLLLTFPCASPCFSLCVVVSSRGLSAVRPADGRVGVVPGGRQHGAHVPQPALLVVVRHVGAQRQQRHQRLRRPRGASYGTTDRPGEAPITILFDSSPSDGVDSSMGAVASNKSGSHPKCRQREKPWLYGDGEVQETLDYL